MNQFPPNNYSIDFDPRRLARTSDPSTSHEAARRVREFRKGHALLILECLRQHGDLTVDEMAKHTGLSSHQINKRTSELHDANLIITTGAERPSASGRPERVWGLKR